MASPRAPWTEMAYALLADGQWHDRDTVVAQVIHLVPPGRAVRQAEADRLRQVQVPPPEGAIPTRRVPRSPEYIQRVGARRLVLMSFAQTFDTRVADGQTWIRLRTGSRRPT